MLKKITNDSENQEVVEQKYYLVLGATVYCCLVAYFK